MNLIGFFFINWGFLILFGLSKHFPKTNDNLIENSLTFYRSKPVLFKYLAWLSILVSTLPFSFGWDITTGLCIWIISIMFSPSVMIFLFNHHKNWIYATVVFTILSLPIGIYRVIS